MISEIPSSALPALPVRRRETLEIFDTALKLYRRYFGVLLAWSAISALSFLTVWFAQIAFLFTSPLLFGAVSCCVAAAVRGQSVGFRQCWQFTKPRYGAMLGAIVLSWILLGVAGLVLYIAAIFIGIGGAFALANAPVPVQVVGGVLGVLLLLVGFSVLGVAFLGWATMVPIISCLEDDKRGVPALGRAFELLKGHWRRVFGMSLLIGLAILAVFAIIGGLYALVAGVASIETLFGSPDSAILGMVAVLSGFWAFFSIFWSPAQTLVIAVLYLDLRVRREALDLEWTAYASAPPIPNLAPGAVALNNSELAPLSSPLQPPLLGSEPGMGPTSLAAGGAPFVGAVGQQPEEPTEFSADSFAAPVVLPAVIPITEPPSGEESAVTPPTFEQPDAAPTATLPDAAPFHSIFPPASSVFESPAPLIEAPDTQPEQNSQSGENEVRRDT